MNSLINMPFIYLSETITYTNKQIEETNIKGKTSFATKRILAFKKILEEANNKLNLKEFEYNLTPAQAKKELKKMDNLFFALSKLIEIFKSFLTNEQINIFENEYKIFVERLENFRENIEILADEEICEETKKIYNGTYNKNDFVCYDI